MEDNSGAEENEGGTEFPEGEGPDPEAETQLSRLPDEDLGLNDSESGKAKGKQFYSLKNIKSLHHVLDEHQGKRSWHTDVRSQIPDFT